MMKCFLFFIVSFFIATEARLFFQEGRDHHSIMIYLSYRSDGKESPVFESLEINESLISIKEHLELRNLIKNLLDEDAYEE